MKNGLTKKRYNIKLCFCLQIPTPPSKAQLWCSTTWAPPPPSPVSSTTPHPPTSSGIGTTESSTTPTTNRYVTVVINIKNS